VQVWGSAAGLSTETEAASVVVGKVAPELSRRMYLREHRPNNLLRWDLDVEPTMTAKNAPGHQLRVRMELTR